MKLKDIIAAYRKEHNMSMREFGRKCGLSNAYISILETGVNPRSGEPLSPTVDTYNKIAHAMGISLNDLFEMLNADELITINATEEFNSEQFDEYFDPLKKKLLEHVKQLPAEDLNLYNEIFSLSTERLQAIVDLLK